MADARCLHGPELAAALRDARAVTRVRVDDLSDEEWAMPLQPGVNPVAWELAHLAWFGEFWILRGPHRRHADGLVYAERATRIAGPDAHFDSARLAHDLRWTTPMPSRSEVAEMLDAQLAACLQVLPAGDDDAALYFHRLALFHEDMHGEAFAWTRAALGYPAPPGVALPRLQPAQLLEIPGGEVRIGWPPGRRGFAFDNEGAGARVVLQDYEIDDAPVSAGQFLRFVEAGGYERGDYWPGAAGRWRAASPTPHPARWRRGSHGWELRWFDRWLALDPDQAVIHVNAWEAEAYCRWAGRRLPRAAEWEHAAVTQPTLRWGHCVWEWTMDAFLPYSGFMPGPYHDYSVPWFGDHRELRGGAFATHDRMHDARYRNFFQPQRNDVFAGFRTAALLHT
ncbi:MAG: Serine/threonine kinase [Burkholderiaceae bacterium]|nr:MAG: Serine/threonine kinase [Burkholderiaceae bacterium]